jgi:hypothetical protein
MSKIIFIKMKAIIKLFIIYFLNVTQISCFDYLKIKTPSLFQVSQVTTNAQQCSKVVELTTGDFAIVWHGTIPTSGYFNIQFNVYDFTGTTLKQNNVIVNAVTSASSIYPDVCSDGNGGFVIVWEENDQQNSSYTKAFIRHYDSSYTAGGIISIKQSTAYSFVIPAIDRLANGNYVAFFTNSVRVYFQLIDSTFNLIGGNVFAQDSSYNTQAYSVKGLMNGGFVTAWFGGAGDVYMKFFDKDGLAKGNEMLINTNNQAGSQDYPKIAVLTNGNVVVTWNDQGLNSGDVIGKIFDQTGQAVSGFISLSALTIGKQNNPRPFSLSWGGFGVVWESQETQRNIKLQIFDVNGNKIGSEKMVNTGVSSGMWAAHATELVKTGNSVVTWTDSGSTNYVWVQIYYKNDGICKDIQASLGNATSIKIDFSTVPYDSIVIKTLPTQGQLKDDAGTVLSLNTLVDKTKVTYFSNAQNSDSFTFASNTVDPSCKVDILNCYKSCLTCSQAGDVTNHNCIQCNPGLYKLADNTINNCYSTSEIPQGYYLDTTYNVIRKCYESCFSCSQKGDSIKNNCLKCLNSFYPLEQDITQCYSTTNVPQGYYLDTSLGAFVKCYDSCLTCNSKGDSGTHNCLKCLDYYYPLEDKINQCYPYTEVINGYFFNIETLNFTRCYQSCGTCKMLGDINQHICLSCKNNFFPLENDNSMCFAKDATVLGYYLDFNNNVFRKCYKSCSKCTGPGDIINPNCIECDPTYPSCSGCTEKIYKDNCIDGCPILTTFNPITQICSDCKPGELVYNNQCIATCPDGYIQDSYLCVTCADKNMYYYKNYCVQSCPDGSKLNTSNNTCEIICLLGYYDIVTGACISCGSISKLYFQGICVDSCPENYVQIGTLCQKSINAEIGKVYFKFRS